MNAQELMDVLIEEFGSDSLEEFLLDSVQPGVCANCLEIQDQCEPDVDRGDYGCCEQSEVYALEQLLIYGASPFDAES